MGVDNSIIIKYNTSADCSIRVKNTTSPIGPRITYPGGGGGREDI